MNHELPRDFVFNAQLDLWEGRAFVPFWGEELPVAIEAAKEGPSDKQLEGLRAILSSRPSLRGHFQQKVFDYYKSEIEGKIAGYFKDGIDVTDQCVPTLKNPEEIWRLLHEPQIQIRPLKTMQPSIIFEIYMGCTWDEEHGLSALFKDWSIVQIAAMGDCDIDGV